MSVRFFFSLFLLALASLRVGIAADAGVPPFAPTTVGIQSYEGIWKRSPFIVETVAEQVSVGLAARFSLVGVVSMAGQPAIFLVDKNNGDPNKNRVMLSKARPSGDGIELVSVAMGADPRKSSAVIRQGGQQATLPFDSTAMGPTGPTSQVGAIPPPPTGLIPPPILPTTVPPPNGAMGVRPNSPSATPPPSPRRIIRPAPINLNN